MIYLLLRKGFAAAAALLALVTLAFLLMKALPGDPFSEELLPAEIHAAMRSHYGLDDPWHEQYGRYLAALLQGEMGPSLKYPELSVNEIIKEGLPVSMLLGAQALLVAVGAGIFLGTLAAMKRNQFPDSLAMVVATLGISIPNFALAVFLQYLFAIKLSLLPVARWGGLSHALLPALALAAMPTAFIARLVRAKLIETGEQPYIKTARAKGLTKGMILRRHLLPNALLPLLGYLGQLAANILVGSFVIERIFAIPGLGQWFVHSVLNRDYTAIIGLTVLYGLLLMGLTLAMDLLALALDPQLRARQLARRERRCV